MKNILDQTIIVTEVAEWQRRFWSTTASRYIGFVTWMLLGLGAVSVDIPEFHRRRVRILGASLVLVRLWDPVGFRFGFTAQKAVAEKTATGDMAGLLELGWHGAACMLPLLFLGRKVVREMVRP